MELAILAKPKGSSASARLWAVSHRLLSKWRYWSHKDKWKKFYVKPGQKDPCQLRPEVWIYFLAEKIQAAPCFKTILSLETGTNFYCWSSNLMAMTSPRHPSQCSLTTEEAGEAEELVPLQLGSRPRLQSHPSMTWKAGSTSQVTSICWEEQTLKVFVDHSPITSYHSRWWHKVKAVVPKWTWSTLSVLSHKHFKAAVGSPLSGLWAAFVWDVTIFI